MQKYHKRATFKVRSHRLLCPCTQSLVSGVFSEVLMEDGIFHMMRSPCRGLKGAKKGLYLTSARYRPKLSCGYGREFLFGLTEI